MAHCLIALGSNLGDRAAHLRHAVESLARTPGVQIVARSAWHETRPVGGPGAQPAYLNGAVLASTRRDPANLWIELTRIEQGLGRVRNARWEARTIDLDILLYDRAMVDAADLVVPHPRMHYRRFVLEPACEVAPWMVHPPSGWTVSRLAELLDHGADEIAVASIDPHLGVALCADLERLFLLTGHRAPRVTAWEGDSDRKRRPKLILAIAAGSDETAVRRILQLPAGGPIAWLAPGDAAAMREDAIAIVASAWPSLAASGG
jgi:2-amino-4-hydroxy-6-hydroxymethyldihydropteridine diphosphokinase